jgi:hypothetical protein
MFQLTPLTTASAAAAVTTARTASQGNRTTRRAKRTLGNRPARTNFRTPLTDMLRNAATSSAVP